MLCTYHSTSHRRILLCFACSDPTAHTSFLGSFHPHTANHHKINLPVCRLQQFPFKETDISNFLEYRQALQLYIWVLSRSLSCAYQNAHHLHDADRHFRLPLLLPPARLIFARHIWNIPFPHGQQLICHLGKPHPTYTLSPVVLQHVLTRMLACMQGRRPCAPVSCTGRCKGLRSGCQTCRPEHW